MMVCHRRNMAAKEPRTACLECMYAVNRTAPFDPEGACVKCKGDLEPNLSIMPDNYYKCVIRNAIFTEVLRRRNNAYVAHNIVRCTIPNILLDFMKRFMAEVAGKGRMDSALAWDKEEPRVLAKNFRDSKTWFFTTFGAVAHLASFEP